MAEIEEERIVDEDVETQLWEESDDDTRGSTGLSHFYNTVLQLESQRPLLYAMNTFDQHRETSTKSRKEDEEDRWNSSS